MSSILSPISVLSVCTNLPTDHAPVRGLFVRRRLEKMAERCQLTALMPQPYFPFLRPIHGGDNALAASFPIANHGMFYLPGVLKRLDGRWMKRCVTRWLRKIEFNRPAVIDAHFGYPEGVGCYHAAKEFDLPFFITLRGLEVDLLRDPIMRPLLVDAMQHATGVIAVSEFLRQAAISAGVSESKIDVISNGVDTTLFSPGDRDQARDFLGIDRRVPLVVCVGTLKAVKGHDVLIKAMSQVIPQVPARLVCIGGHGDPTWAKRMAQLVASQNIADNVSFIGSQSPDQVVNWLRAADLFSLASHREGCCNAVLEAIATGTHVVATRVGDNEQIVDSAVNGTLVAPGDSDAMAEAIVDSLSRSHDSEAIARSVAMRSWDRAADHVIKLFESKL